MVESDASTKTVAKMEPIFPPLGVQLELAICEVSFQLIWSDFSDLALIRTILLHPYFTAQPHLPHELHDELMVVVNASVS